PPTRAPPTTRAPTAARAGPTTRPTRWKIKPTRRKTQPARRKTRPRRRMTPPPPAAARAAPRPPSPPASPRGPTMPAAAITEHLSWIPSRAAGPAALLLSSVAVCVGLLFGGKLVKGRPDLRHLHEALSLATIVALVVHAVSLLGDSFLHPSIADISIPFVSGYMRMWTTIGIVAGWAMIALGLSYY